MYLILPTKSIGFRKIMRKFIKFRVNFTWDDEASVWIAQSEDIPGLVLEGGSLDALFERVCYAVPELIELNQSPVTNSLFFNKAFKLWKDSGYIVISMRDDFKTIYGDTVKKVQFEF